MPGLKTVLIIDDNLINRKMLHKILSNDYSIIEAENGKVALDILREHKEIISAIMLDLMMPVMDGYEFLEIIRYNCIFSNIPIIVTTGNSDNENEIKALKLGACDYVCKPYNSDIIKFRLKNVIERSQLSIFKQLKYLAEYDTLTGLYNKTKFSKATRKMIDKNCGDSFVIIRFDIDRFQLINSFFGIDEGDNLLKYIACELTKYLQGYSNKAYGRIETDIFGICIPYDKKNLENFIRKFVEIIKNYNLNFNIKSSFGVYIIDDISIPVNVMYDRATLASKECKGSYIKFYSVYNDDLSQKIIREQEIINEMEIALKEEQFEIYLQPKYNLKTNMPNGAEALVRWKHKKKGMISPGEFIPIFERNGFITRLDYYVWERVCRLLHKWIEEGKSPYPISVNVSRVNLYNPHLDKIILKLVKKYNITPSLLNLELTESAYTDNPMAMKEMMHRLKDKGFIIMMDDFGSGYSSLNILKDIDVDILKIDMRFLSKTEIKGRAENIIASVVRMAKWINMPVVAEGVENLEQVKFLRSIGCEFVQGFYFSKPMPISEYEKLIYNIENININNNNNKVIHPNKFDVDYIWSSNLQKDIFFDEFSNPVVVYEFDNKNIEIIRVNNAFYELFGYDDNSLNKINKLDCMEFIYRHYHKVILDTFNEVVRDQKNSECDYIRRLTNGKKMWVNNKIKYINKVGDKHILVGILTDITDQKKIDNELQKYKSVIIGEDTTRPTILIVDDVEVNRAVLRDIFKDEYKVLEANNGEDAFDILKKHENEVDIILLDLMMPVMDGKEFLKNKNRNPKISNIPVIIISADDTPEQQIKSLSLGVSDYVVKPFVEEVVSYRVKNVLESNKRFKTILKEYNTVVQRLKIDNLTGIINTGTVKLLDRPKEETK